MSIVIKTINGLKWNTLGTVFISILQLMQVLYLSYMFSPSELGLTAIILLIIGLSQAYSDAGLSGALISFQNLKQKHLNTLYLINVISGLAMFVFMYYFSSYLAEFFEIPAFSDQILLISILFVITPFGVQFNAILQRNLAFDILIKIEFFARLLSVSTCATLVTLKIGPDSVIYGALCGAFLQTGLLLYVGFRNFPLSFDFTLSEILPILKFGFFQMGEKTINFLTNQLDIIIIGNSLEIADVGVYSIVKQLFEKSFFVLNGVINRVIFPSLASVKSARDRLSEGYQVLLLTISAVQMPLIALVYFFGYEFLSTYLGGVWQEAENIIPLFALIVFFKVFANPSGALLLAVGRANLSFYINFGLAAGSYLFIVFGLKIYGVEGVLFSLIALQILIFYPIWRIMIIPFIDISFKRYFAMLASTGTFSFSCLLSAKVLFHNAQFWQKEIMYAAILFFSLGLIVAQFFTLYKVVFKKFSIIKNRI